MQDNGRRAVANHLPRTGELQFAHSLFAITERDRAPDEPDRLLIAPASGSSNTCHTYTNVSIQRDPRSLGEGDRDLLANGAMSLNQLLGNTSQFGFRFVAVNDKAALEVGRCARPFGQTRRNQPSGA